MTIILIVMFVLGVVFGCSITSIYYNEKREHGDWQESRRDEQYRKILDEFTT